MTFDKKDLEKVSKLARLYLDENEKEKLLIELDKIVDFVAQLNEVDVSLVEPMAYPHESVLTLREDQAFEQVGRKGLMGSKGYDEGLVKVPKIIE